MKLRPYHNPENVDESRVPSGWRFRYADEMKFPHYNARFSLHWSMDSVERGRNPSVTYIVPVT
jgi:hypothetical protein